MAPRTPVAVIIGPTASGKSALALEVGRRVESEIISMDSRQIYRGLEIGTAKPTAAERGSIPHHGIDLVEPVERFSAGRFGRYARRTIEAIQARGRVPLLVGGTGFFLRALTHPIFAEPELDPARRAALEAYLSEQEESTLHRWLRELDPLQAERLAHWGGRQRLLRALELPLLSGRTLSWWQAEGAPEAEPLRPLVFALEMPRERLVARIDARLEAMLEAGLVEELVALLRSGIPEDAPGLHTTGYVELLPHLRGEISLDEAVEAIRRNTRAYARRQVSWIRNQLPAGTILLDATRPVEALTEEVIRTLGEHASTAPAAP